MNDIASYRCVARNSLGETDGRIKLYGAVTNRSCMYKWLDFLFFCSSERSWGGGDNSLGDGASTACDPDLARSAQEGEAHPTPAPVPGTCHNNTSDAHVTCHPQEADQAHYPVYEVLGPVNTMSGQWEVTGCQCSVRIKGKSKEFLQQFWDLKFWIWT